MLANDLCSKALSKLLFKLALFSNHTALYVPAVFLVSFTDVGDGGGGA